MLPSAPATGAVSARQCIWWCGNIWSLCRLLPSVVFNSNEQHIKNHMLTRLPCSNMHDQGLISCRSLSSNVSHHNISDAECVTLQVSAVHRIQTHTRSSLCIKQKCVHHSAISLHCPMTRNCVTLHNYITPEVCLVICSYVRALIGYD